MHQACDWLYYQASPPLSTVHISPIDLAVSPTDMVLPQSNSAALEASWHISDTDICSRDSVYKGGTGGAERQLTRHQLLLFPRKLREQSLSASKTQESKKRFGIHRTNKAKI